MHKLFNKNKLCKNLSLRSNLFNTVTALCLGALRNLE